MSAQGPLEKHSSSPDTSLDTLKLWGRSLTTIGDIITVCTFVDGIHVNIVLNGCTLKKYIYITWPSYLHVIDLPYVELLNELI